jgi:uncharacterized protein
MFYAVELAFDPAKSERRLELRPAHRQVLAGLFEKGILKMSGPWEDDSGALLIVDTDAEGIERILADDPYFEAPGVTVVAVRRWQPIMGTFGEEATPS